MRRVAAGFFISCSGKRSRPVSWPAARPPAAVAAAAVGPHRQCLRPIPRRRPPFEAAAAAFAVGCRWARPLARRSSATARANAADPPRQNIGAKTRSRRATSGRGNAAAFGVPRAALGIRPFAGAIRSCTFGLVALADVGRP